MELNGDKDVQKTDKEGGEEKYRGLQANRKRFGKKHHKEEPKKELDVNDHKLSSKELENKYCTNITTVSHRQAGLGGTAL